MRAASIGVIPCQPEDWLRCSDAELPSVNGISLHLDPSAALEMPRLESVVTVPGISMIPVAGVRASPPWERTNWWPRCCDAGPASWSTRRSALRFLGSASALLHPSSSSWEPKPMTTAGGLAIGCGLRTGTSTSADLFAPAPDLEACGGIEGAARTWVTIHAASGAETELFCAPDGSGDPAWLSFARRTGEDPPPEVYVEMFDRVDEVVYRSEPVPLTRQRA